MIYNITKTKFGQNMLLKFKALDGCRQLYNKRLMTYIVGTYIVDVIYWKVADDRLIIFLTKCKNMSLVHAILYTKENTIYIECSPWTDKTIKKVDKVPEDFKYITDYDEFCTKIDLHILNVI